MTAHRSGVLLLPLVLIAVALCLPAAAQTFRLQVTADPPRLVYGDDNRVRITVSVRTPEGQPADDGTSVFFNTTLGTMPTVAYTQQGLVSVLLENTTGPGLAIVTVTVAATRQTLQVEFLGKNGEAAVVMPKRVSYRIKGQQIAYSVDKRIFDVQDQAQLIGPAFTVHAGALQYNPIDGTLCAQNRVLVTAGAKSFFAEKLRLNLTASSGEAAVIEPEIGFKLLKLPSLDAEDDTQPLTTEHFTPINPRPTRTWILCKEAVVFPNSQIQFRRPSFYMENFDRRLFALPYHVLDLRDSSTGKFFNSEISLTSDAGLNVDFPIYYAASPNHIGSLHLRRVAKGSSSYSGSAGIEVGIEEEYLIGDNGDGGLYLDNLTEPTRGVTWEHTHDFGKLHVDLNASYDRYTETTPYTTRTHLTLSRPLGDVHTSLATTWSSFNQNQDSVSELSVQFPGIKLWRSGLSLGFDTYLGFQRAVNSEDATPTTTDEFYQGLRGGLDFPTYHLLGGSLRPNISDEISHDGDGALTNFFDAGVNYNRKITGTFSASANYAYSIAHSNASDAVSEPAAQRVSLGINGNGGSKWNASLYSNYNIDNKSLYHSASLLYNLPWFRSHPDRTRLFFRYNASASSGDLTTADHLFSLGCNLGTYALVVHYSPTGNNAVTGIGSGTGQRWAFELVRMGW